VRGYYVCSVTSRADFGLRLLGSCLDRPPHRRRTSVDWAALLGTGPTRPSKSNGLGPRAMQQLVVELCVNWHQNCWCSWPLAKGCIDVLMSTS
jgi:hypothetical protein